MHHTQWGVGLKKYKEGTRGMHSGMLLLVGWQLSLTTF